MNEPDAVPGFVAWVDQVQAHIDTAVDAAQEFVCAWEDPEASADAAAAATAKLVEVVRILEQLLERAP